MGDLFGDFPPYQRHSETSFDAASEIEPNAGTLRAKVLEFLRALPSGATDEEIQLALEMNPSTQRPRRVELVDRGLVFDSGNVRLTKSKRRAVVWQATRKE